jgi:hypothetical protein
MRWTLGRSTFCAALMSAAVSLCMLAAAAQAGWLVPANISPAGEHVGSPHVVLNSEGQATAVWDRWNGSDYVVESADRPAGQTWHAPADLSAAPEEVVHVSGEHDAYEPAIAVDGHGDDTVVWSRSGGVNRIIIQSADRAAGAGWQAPVAVGEVHTEQDPEPQIAVDGVGDATAVWDNSGVVETAYRPANGGWESPVALSGAKSFVPQVAVDTAGDATVAWLAYDGSKYVVRTAYRPAGAGWQAPTNLSVAGEEGGDPHIAVDARGDATVAWSGEVGGSEFARAVSRPAGGSWEAPVDVSAEGRVQSLRVAMDAKGDALLAWAGSSPALGGFEIAQAAYRPAAGSWQMPANLSEPGGDAFPQDAVLDAQGNAAVTWERSDGSRDIAQLAYRPLGGGWNAPVNLSETGKDATDAEVVLDAPGGSVPSDGDAVAVWDSQEGTPCGIEPGCVEEVSDTVQAASYDAGPVLEGVAIPSSATAGQPVTFSVSPLDVWGLGETTWTFGDGSSAAGTSVSHTYAAAGQYEVAVQSEDLLGSKASTSAVITIAPSRPTITEVDPDHGRPSGRTVVTITGTGFTGAEAVRFGPRDARSFTVNSATSITAISPNGKRTVDVTVTTPAGTSATGSADHFTYGHAHAGHARAR